MPAEVGDTAITRSYTTVAQRYGSRDFLAELALAGAFPEAAAATMKGRARRNPQLWFGRGALCLGHHIRQVHLSEALRAQGERVGRNRVAGLMKEAGIEGRQGRRYRVRTTDSRHDDPIAPNRLADASPPAKPDEVWVADITYVETTEGWLYLAGVLDLCSRWLVGWAMGSNLDTSLPLAALRMALRQRRPAPGVLHHSDRGSQSMPAPLTARSSPITAVSPP